MCNFSAWSKIFETATGGRPAGQQYYLMPGKACTFCAEGVESIFSRNSKPKNFKALQTYCFFLPKPLKIFNFSASNKFSKNGSEESAIGGVQAGGIVLLGAEHGSKESASGIAILLSAEDGGEESVIGARLTG